MNVMSALSKSVTEMSLQTMLLKCVAMYDSLIVPLPCEKAS